MPERTTDKTEAQGRLRKSRTRLGIYQHWKGGIYVVFCTSIDEARLEPLVHYYSKAKKKRWTRTLEVFTQRIAGGKAYHLP